MIVFRYHDFSTCKVDISCRNEDLQILTLRNRGCNVVLYSATNW